MGKWIKSGCPRCGGSMFIDNDMDGWYEQCLNCSFRQELRDATDRPPIRVYHPTAEEVDNPESQRSRIVTKVAVGRRRSG
jgi:ribosomal protein S27AE